MNITMHKVTIYDKGTGEILSVSSISQESINLNPQYGYVYDRFGTTDNHYVVNGEIVERPPQQTTLTNSTLTNLPAPCTISINGTLYSCVDGTAELRFNQPVLYTIIVRAFPYLDFETTYDNRA